MKINRIQILLLLLLYSCHAKQEKQVDKGADPSEIATKTLPASTEYKYPGVKIPDNFYSDSITIYDTISKAKFEACYLQSHLPEMESFNEIILQAVKAHIRTERSYLCPYNGDSNTEFIFTYRLSPVEIYSDSHVISICNIIDTYTEGGNHHNYTWCTFSYDLRTNKRLEFPDIFNLQSHSDSVEFIAFAEQHTLDGGCTEWGWIHEPLDFSFTDKGIYINPNLSWACAETRSLLPVNTGNRFIRKEWIP